MHVLGICGTFMAGLACLAHELGHHVTGSDQNVYPPMSDFLAAAGIGIRPGWDPAHLDPRPDLVVIGNALSRGNPLVEAVLDLGLPYTSGPEWLARHVLPGRHVIAVAGTHGKTTTSSLVAWMLERAGHAPGFLIGGIPENFGRPARLGTGECFVIEADEYDTAFFDKRSKFVHYRPMTALLNNLEFDHADIFPDLAAIETQFHHLVRTVPGRGTVVWNRDEPALAATLARGAWSRLVTFGTGDEAAWQLREHAPGHYAVRDPDGRTFPLRSPLAGRHNALNTLAALATVDTVGLAPEAALLGLDGFLNVKRRLQVVGSARGITVYDDFAHHPTAIAATLQALRERVGSGRIVAVLEPRSNTMRMGVMSAQLAPALAAADTSVIFAPAELRWDIGAATAALGERRHVCESAAELVATIARLATPGSHVVIMSNGDFGGLHRQLLATLAA
ncbi:MAG: UDP-N-acetylmuramate:L-alanyl-gamma-D-glutamyl-meso-diaminopimelate ligase [Gammaproteobacteria bacterium]